MQSARRERQESKARSNYDFQRQKSADIKHSRDVIAQRKAELEQKERQLKAQKMCTAMEVRKQKQEAAQRKAELEQKYREHIRKNYVSKMQEQDSKYSQNLSELQELE